MKTIEHMQKEIAQLDGPVLSIYLNTNPRSEDWKIQLKNGLKKTAQYVEAGNPQQSKQVAAICDKVDAAVTDSLRSEMTNSFICFATTEQVLIYHLQVPVENDFQWHEQPKTDQLQALFDTYANTGVLLLQHDKITLISTVLGRLEDEVSYELDLEKEDWKQYKGLAFGGIISSSATHTHQFESRLRENQARWYREIVPTIEKYAKDKQWNGVHLAGPAALTHTMKELLHLNVVGETTKNYAGTSADEVLEKTILAEKQAVQR